MLKHLAETGYTQVEGFGGVMGDPAGLRAMMDRAGPDHAVSAHFAIDDLEAKPDEMLALAEDAWACRSMYAPFPAPERPPHGWGGMDGLRRAPCCESG